MVTHHLAASVAEGGYYLDSLIIKFSLRLFHQSIGSAILQSLVVLLLCDPSHPAASLLPGASPSLSLNLSLNTASNVLFSTATAASLIPSPSRCVFASMIMKYGVYSRTVTILLHSSLSAVSNRGSHQAGCGVYSSKYGMSQCTHLPLF